LARKSRESIEAGEQSLMRDLVNGNLDEITGATVGQAVQQGDALALDIVREAGRIIGLGMVSLLHLFNPEILVFGGGVSNIGEPLFAPMREAIQRYCIDRAYWENLKIEPAALGENVSIIGAAALVVTEGGVANISAAIARMKGG
jgi:glucokinase